MISANTGVAPQYSAAAAVAAKVNDGTIASLPSGISSAAMAVMSPMSPLAIARTLALPR